MKAALESLLRSALGALPETLVPAEARGGVEIEVLTTRDEKHGDFASNLAMRLAKGAKQNPRRIAEALIGALPANESLAKVQIAGAGFINFFLKRSAYHAEIGRALAEGAAYGCSPLGLGKKAQVEFVSANPTGPLHVGHGRHAAYGACVANLLSAAGYDVEREYYLNDAGRQMDILAVSTWLRYLELCGERFTFPSDGYVGEYIVPIAERLKEREGGSLKRSAAEVFAALPKEEPGGEKDQYIDALILRVRELLGPAAFRRVQDLATESILADIRQDLEEFGIRFDRWFSERSLSDDGAVDEAIARLKVAGHTYMKDGALWFKSTNFGDEKDRVILRDNGVKTYFASDIAYLFNKLGRGFERLLYVLGADHHGYAPRLRAMLLALGGPPECLEVRFLQFVTLFRGGDKVPMSTRSGRFVTLRELRDEVGNDAARLFYVMRSNDQHLDFDLDLAKARSHENPVYYIQYAHARVASVLKQLAARGLAVDTANGLNSLSRLTEPQESALIKRLARYPETLAQCAQLRAPHSLVYFLRDLANDFHTYYSAHQFIVEDQTVRDARLTLSLATQVVLRNGLKLLGVCAPDTM